MIPAVVTFDEWADLLAPHYDNLKRAKPWRMLLRTGLSISLSMDPDATAAVENVRTMTHATFPDVLDVTVERPGQPDPEIRFWFNSPADAVAFKLRWC